jgi:hypothetical protein
MGIDGDEGTDKMTYAIDKQIAETRARIEARKTALKVAQDQRDDWKAGNLRVAIGREQQFLTTLESHKRSQRVVAPVSNAIFFGSNH